MKKYIITLLTAFMVLTNISVPIYAEEPQPETESSSENKESEAFEKVHPEDPEEIAITDHLDEESVLPEEEKEDGLQNNQEESEEIDITDKTDETRPEEGSAAEKQTESNHEPEPETGTEEAGEKAELLNGTYGDLTYEINNGEVTINKCKTTATSVVVPEKIDGYPVTKIADQAFMSCTNLVKIELSDRINYIGERAFSGCTGLVSITIPEGVTTLQYTFYNCINLKEVILPNTLTTLKEYSYISSQGDLASAGVFQGCSSLTKITLPSSLKTIEAYAFKNCTSLTSVNIPNSVTVMHGGVFSGCTSLKTVKLPDNLTAISNVFYSKSGKTASSDMDSGMFYNCTSLEKITIPDSVKSVSAYTFYGCNNLVDLTIPDGVSFSDYAFNEGGKKLKSAGPVGSNSNIKIRNIGTQWDQNMKYFSALESVVIPEPVVTIGKEAFKNCTSLTSLTIPNSIEAISNSTFYGCTGLKSAGPVDGDFNIKMGWISKIPDGAFNGFTYLNSVTIPDAITEIGSSAFYNCNGISNLVISNDVKIGVSAFAGCTNLISAGPLESSCDIRIYGSGEFGKNMPAFDYLTKVIVPDTFTSIADYAFSDKTRLKTVMLPDTIVSFGEKSFFNCSNLKDINFPETIKEIKENAFSGCGSISSIRLSNDGIKIAENAFTNCTGLLTAGSDSDNTNIVVTGIIDEWKLCMTPFSELESVRIPNGVSAISDYAFKGCTKLNSINIPESVKKIGSSTFDNCTSLESAGPEGGEYNYEFGWSESIPENAFRNLLNLKKIVIPESIKEIGICAFEGCISLVTAGPAGGNYNYEFGWKTEIPAFAFYRCNGLESAIIPTGITKIGEQCFAGCVNLLSVELPEGLQQITYKLFYDCPQIKKVNMPASVSSIGSYAFYNCEELTSIIIPDEVNLIDDYTFFGCTNLSTIKIPGSVTSIGNHVFDGCQNLLSAGPMGGGYNYEFGWTDSIPDRAFKNCTNMTKIVVPEGVNSIGSEAFYNLFKMVNVTLPGTIKKIGTQAFEECSNLQTIYFNGYHSDWLDIEKADNNKLKNTTIVYLDSAKGITLNQQQITLIKGSNETLIVVFSPENAYNKKVTWETSDENVATVNENGVVTAKKSGVATIKAISEDGNFTTNCKVTVITPVTSISLDFNQIEIIKGSTFELKANVLPLDADNKKVIWESSNESIATVSSTGVVKGIKKGKTVIVATTEDDGLFSKCEVEVVIPVTSVTLNKTSVSMNIGDQQELIATVKPADATNQSVIWVSSDDKIASVDNIGVVTANAKGSAIITVSTVDGNYTGTCKVTVIQPATSIVLNYTELTVKTGRTKSISATVLPSDTNNKTVSWSSSNTSVAKVSSYGTITGVSKGTAVITARTHNGLTAQCKVTVVQSVTSVSLNKTSLVLEPEETEQLSAAVKPADAFDQSVSWKSSDESIATVDEKGLVKAKDYGMCTITVMTNDGNYTAECTVKVVKAVKSISLEDQWIQIKMGQSEKLSYTILPEDADDKSVTWSTSNSSVATVSSDGTVKAINVGDAVITVKTNNGGHTATCKVVVLQIPTSITLDKKELTLLTGETEKLTATVLPTTAYDKSVTWSSSSAKIATVDSEGNVKGLREGTATITATTKDGNKKATCTVKVYPRVSGVSLNKNLITLLPGKTEKLVATVSPASALDKSVVWKSSNEKVATVNENGVVTAKSGGDAVITVTTNDGGKTAECKVHVIIRTTGLELDLYEKTLEVGESFVIHTKVLPENAENKGIRYSSSNSRILEVTKNKEGEYVAVAHEPGDARIVFTTEEGGYSAICNVTIDHPVVSFVKRLYRLCFNREADQGGLAGWSSKLQDGTYTAAYVVSAFFTSKEMQNLKLSNEEFVERCYLVMMGRASDSGGKKNWVEKLDAGMSLTYVLRGFVGSREFDSVSVRRF